MLLQSAPGVIRMSDIKQVRPRGIENVDIVHKKKAGL
jgi:hypothetical protein